MTTRTVTGTIHQAADHTPPVGGQVTFSLKEAITSGGALIPPRGPHKAVLDTTGSFSVDLEVSDSGSAHYEVRTPDGVTTQVYLASGSPLPLGKLLNTPGSSKVTDPTGTLPDPRLGQPVNVETNGAVGDGATDDAPAINAAVTALAAKGGIIKLLAGKTYYLASSILLPPAITNRLVISGYGATIKLSSGSPTAFVFNRTADYQTFQNVTIEGMAIDGNNIAGPSITGELLGNISQRANFGHIIIRDVYGYNFPTDVSGNTIRYGVCIASKHLGAGETQTSITDVLCENVRIEGGKYGIAIFGAGPAVDGLNIYLDNIQIHHCYHDTLVTGYSFGANNFHVGSRSFGGSVHIFDCEGYGAGDTSIEVNGFMDTLVENCYVKNSCGHGFMAPNFHTPSTNVTAGGISTVVPNLAGQVLKFKNCVHYSNIPGVSPAFFFCSGHTPDLALNHVILEDCKYFSECATLSAHLYYGDAIYVTDAIGKLDIINFQHFRTGFVYTTAVNNAYLGSLLAPTSTCEINIRNISFYIRGTASGAGAGFPSFYPMRINGTDAVLNMDGYSVDINVTGCSTYGAVGLDIGQAASSKINGVIRNLKIINLLDDSAPRGVIVRANSTLTIPDRILIDGCDFSHQKAGKEILVGDDLNKAKVVYQNCVYIGKTSE